jgi:hypothetical protein
LDSNRHDRAFTLRFPHVQEPHSPKVNQRNDQRVGLDEKEAPLKEREVADQFQTCQQWAEQTNRHELRRDGAQEAKSRWPAGLPQQPGWLR